MIEIIDLLPDGAVLTMQKSTEYPAVLVSVKYHGHCSREYVSIRGLAADDGPELLRREVQQLITHATRGGNAGRGEANRGST